MQHSVTDDAERLQRGSQTTNPFTMKSRVDHSNVIPKSGYKTKPWMVTLLSCFRELCQQKTVTNPLTKTI